MQVAYANTTNFSVSYGSTFTGGSNPNGLALAQGVVDYCEYDLARLSLLFGGILPASLPIQIQLVPGSGGADNNGSNTIWCYCDTSTDPLGLPSLVVAEEAEIFMVTQGKGWIPGYSNGEALSRVCAQILYPDRAWLWSTGNSWLNGDPSSPNPARSDFVDSVWPTDQDYVSIGCGSLFLNYLAYQLNYQWPAIIAAGAPTTNTLAETATVLGVSNAWINFSSLMATYLPPPSTLPPQPTQFGQPSEPTDDPFPLGPVTVPVPALYIRHNLADDGTSHTGSLSDSPDIILKNNPVANPQATYSTPASIASDTESDPDVITGRDNYVYLRVWNRGAADGSNASASALCRGANLFLSISLSQEPGRNHFTSCLRRTPSFPKEAESPCKYLAGSASSSSPTNHRSRNSTIPRPIPTTATACGFPFRPQAPMLSEPSSCQGGRQLPVTCSSTFRPSGTASRTRSSSGSSTKAARLAGSPGSCFLT